MAQLNTRIVLRNDVYTAWESSNPVLLKGEIGVEFNPGTPTQQGSLDYAVKIKIGDGVNAWNDLPYFGGDSEIIENVIQEVTNIVNVLGDDKTDGSVIYRIGTLEAEVANKADKAEVEQALGGKADKTYVDDELAKKANAEDITNALAEKANAADVYVKDEVYNKSEVEVYVNNQIGSVGHLKREIVETLPLESSADVDTIYMIKKIGGLVAQDHYEEYMVINGVWELIGNTFVDLSGYVDDDTFNTKIGVIEAAIAQKADKTQVEQDITNAVAPLAIKTEVENALAEKANKADTLEGYGIGDAYTKEEVDAALLLKANQQDYNTLVDEVNKKADAADVYTKGETYSRQEIADLIADITGGESAADVLAALNTYKGENDERVGKVEDRVKALEDLGADDNTIEGIKIAGATDNLEIVNKVVTIPAATTANYGLVKLSEEVGVNEDSVLEVKKINANKIVQETGEWLILNGGTSSI